MKKNKKLYWIHYFIGVTSLILLTILTPESFTSQNNGIKVYVSIPIAVFMIAFVDRSFGMFLCAFWFMAANIVSVNLENITGLANIIITIQLVFAGIFWFILIVLLTELSETIWNFKETFFKKTLVLSLIIPATYILSLWLSQIFLTMTGIMNVDDLNILGTMYSILWNVVYCLVGTSTLLIITYPYMNKWMSDTVLQRVYQKSNTHRIEKNKKTVVRKNNRHWKVNDRMF